MKTHILPYVIVYYFTSFILLPWIFTWLNNVLGWSSIQNTALDIMGLIFILAGVINSAYSYRLFSKEGKGTPINSEPSRQIIHKGLYKYTRNPMYLGHFLLIFGEFFIFGSMSLLLYLCLFIIYTHFVIVFIEEPKLQKRFGVEYEKYKMNVRRYL